MSFAADLTTSLSLALVSAAQLAPPTPRSSSPPPSTTARTSSHAPSASEVDREHDRLSELQSVLSKLDPRKKKAFTAAKLGALVQDTFPPFQALGGATTRGSQTEAVEELALGQLTIAALGVVLGELMEEAERLAGEDRYWEQVEREGWQTGIYLLQCEQQPCMSWWNPTEVIADLRLTASQRRPRARSRSCRRRSPGCDTSPRTHSPPTPRARTPPCSPSRRTAKHSLRPSFLRPCSRIWPRRRKATRVADTRARATTRR